MKRFPIILSNIAFATKFNSLFSFTFVDAVTVANSVFTIFQVISATDQFERAPRKGTSSPSLGEEKNIHNVNKLAPHCGKQRFLSNLSKRFFLRMQAVAQQSVQGSVLQHALQPSVRLLTNAF